MCFREDYYKFTHYFMPHAVFKYGRLLAYRIMRNDKMFIENLKKTWSTIEIMKNNLRNTPPEFSVDIINLNIEHTGIILTIPEAKEEQEAVFIAIIYDKNDNFRYFTYEIGKGNDNITVFFLCEWTSEWKHINYGFQCEREKDIFVKEISNLIVYELF